MDEVSTLLTVSPRQLRRRFKERFGMGPKFAARIKRFGYVNLLLSQRTDLNWQDVIHRTGYFDQAHFIKDFKQFAGEVPSEVMRRHQLREANVHAED
jgi:AraC-like DNA-binding protein